MGVGEILITNGKDIYNTGKKMLGIQEEEFSTGSNGGSMASAIIGVMNIVICITAFYFVFKCGGKFLDFIAACCCSVCYIAYRLAVPCVAPVVQTVQYVQVPPAPAPVA